MVEIYNENQKFCGSSKVYVDINNCLQKMMNDKQLYYMKAVKSILALLLICAFLTAFAACGSDNLRVRKRKVEQRRDCPRRGGARRTNGKERSSSDVSSRRQLQTGENIGIQISARLWRLCGAAIPAGRPERREVLRAVRSRL